MKTATYATALWIVATCAGCGSSSGVEASFGSQGGTPVPARAGSVVVEGCQLDAWQTAQLASPAAQRVLHTVILLCPTARDDGSIVPTQAPAQQELAQQIAQIRSRATSPAWRSPRPTNSANPTRRARCKRCSPARHGARASRQRPRRSRAWRMD